MKNFKEWWEDNQQEFKDKSTARDCAAFVWTEALEEAIVEIGKQSMAKATVNAAKRTIRGSSK